MSQSFHSIYRHGFVRVAACVPSVRIADPESNAAHTLELARQAADRGAVLALFPELGLSAYTLDDLAQQDALLDAVEGAIEWLLVRTADLKSLLVVGAPLRLEGKLFNCAVLLLRGRTLGVVPKSYLPNYREFYEKRQYVSARHAVGREAWVAGQRVPFGNDLVFEAANLPGFALHVEICEDLWVPVPPSTWAALGGATLLANLSASNITIGKADYRRSLCLSQSAKCLAAYLYTAAGPGESTTDLAWDGHAMVAENGELLAETERFAPGARMALADVDLDRLRQDRMRLTSFTDQVADFRERLATLRRVAIELEAPAGVERLTRPPARFPYVPADPASRDQRCYEAYHIQVEGLAQRLAATGIQRVVIGVSGGLDSTHALLVAARAMDRLGRPRRNVLAYTMPGFATSERTLLNASRLMQALGVQAGRIDIRPSALQMLRDIGHPYAEGKPVYDVTFENVQAGERTSHLFRLANRQNALVVGTGDLSELALGWCTYGVGDQMAHYSVNASVPKTLIRHLIRWIIAATEVDPATSAVLLDILETPISPELIPGQGSEAVQDTEQVIGPFELQDFHLYYITRFGFRPSKVAFLAWQAWGDPETGRWPDFVPRGERRAYHLSTIRQWLEVFLVRFFAQSQFKRSALPNGPKVGSGGSLSPRSDWRAPSDGTAEAWVEELRRNVPEGNAEQ